MEQAVGSGLAEYGEFIAVSVLILGFFAARLARRICGHGLEKLDEWMAQNATTDSGFISPGLIRVSKIVVFWLVIALAIIVALRLLGVGGFSALHEDLIGYLPRLVIGVTIVGAGHVIGLLSRGLISRMSDTIQPDSLVPRLVHGTILVVAVVMGLQQMNIDITFISQLLLVLLTIGTGGLVLAFALGAQRHVANLVARSELRRYSVGERIRIDGQEGAIVAIYATGVDLATEEGVVSIPATRFSSVSVLTLAGDEDDD